MIVPTILATIVYAIVGYLVVPLVVAILRPAIAVLNAIVSGPAAKYSDLGRDRHMRSGMEILYLAVTIAIVWWAAWFTNANFPVNPWPIWIVAIYLSLSYFRTALL